MQETFRSTGRDVMICIDAVWQEKFLVLHSSSKLQVAHFKKCFYRVKGGKEQFLKYLLFDSLLEL